jgi:DNA-binding transcriptional ArsR family regulator
MSQEPPANSCEPHDHPTRRPPKPVSDRAFERAAAIFRAASDESRLRLLQRLSEGEWCVSELAEAAGVGMSTVSQQLRLLRAEHLVTRRRAGKHVWYALADAHVAELIHNALDHAGEQPGNSVDADDPVEEPRGA